MSRRAKVLIEGLYLHSCYANKKVYHFVKKGSDPRDRLRASYRRRWVVWLTPDGQPLAVRKNYRWKDYGGRMGRLPAQYGKEIPLPREMVSILAALAFMHHPTKGRRNG